VETLKSVSTTNSDVFANGNGEKNYGVRIGNSIIPTITTNCTFRQNIFEDKIGKKNLLHQVI
jgi:hypothetical protein